MEQRYTPHTTHTHKHTHTHIHTHTHTYTQASTTNPESDGAGTSAGAGAGAGAGDVAGETGPVRFDDISHSSSTHSLLPTLTICS